MAFLLNLREAWRQARLAGVLLLLCAALGFRGGCSSEPVRPGIHSLLPVAQAAVLPAATVYLAPRRYLLPAGDTLHPAGRPDLQRKMLPASRWRYSGGYLVYPRPRRPRQGALDSAAAAARRAGHD